jgi:hypothetical protein
MALANSRCAVPLNTLKDLGMVRTDTTKTGPSVNR